jgi:hypothetical protein
MVEAICFFNKVPLTPPFLIIIIIIIYSSLYFSKLTFLFEINEWGFVFLEKYCCFDLWV